MMRFKREREVRGRKGDGEEKRWNKSQLAKCPGRSQRWMDDLERENGGRETGDGGVVTKERERID